MISVFFQCQHLMLYHIFNITCDIGYQLWISVPLSPSNYIWSCTQGSSEAIQEPRCVHTCRVPLRELPFRFSCQGCRGGCCLCGTRGPEQARQQALHGLPQAQARGMVQRGPKTLGFEKCALCSQSVLQLLLLCLTRDLNHYLSVSIIWYYVLYLSFSHVISHPVVSYLLYHIE